MRKILMTCMVFVVIVVTGALIYKKFPSKLSVGTTSHTIAELEELVYQNPFKADMQLELARACWRKFEDSMKTDQDAASESLSAYLIACVESNDNNKIYNEFQQRMREAERLMSLPDTPSSETYKNMKMLFLAIRPNIKQIIGLRNDFQTLWVQQDSHSQTSEITKAKEAVKRYLRMVYDVEVGRKMVMNPKTGGNFKFARGYYNALDQGLRSYGLILSERRIPLSDFAVQGSLTEPLDPFSQQIISGESSGRFRLSNGNEVVPGLLYFQHPVQSKELSPSEVYRQFLVFRSQGQWSLMYDMFDEISQRQMTDETKRSLRVLIPTDEGKKRLDAMDGRALFELIGKTSTLNPIEIISEEIAGDKATIKTRIIVDNSYQDSKVHLRRVNRQWKFVWH